MYLKSLTLRGFKSFASATTLRFEPGITAVVGPNGSGKSNVVDALAWVMGEQGAKSLRGGRMEDVIFAGAGRSGGPGRAALGRAEVVLTIDNSDGALPIEYTEVSITRTMFRQGGSDYAINGAPCRLLDVQELLSDSGIGREMHVIVGQGQLDAVLAAGPEERRAFVEEAAGVLKHRRRKEKALRKLDAMAGNLTRVADLTTELRRQLKPLGRQAETARRAQAIAAELRQIRGRLLADEQVRVAAALAQVAADYEVAEAARGDLVHEASAGRLERDRLEALGIGVSANVAGAQQEWFLTSGLAERIAGTVSLARERAMPRGVPVAETGGSDPDELRSEAALLRAAEAEREAEVAAARAATQAAAARRAAEADRVTQAEVHRRDAARAQARLRDRVAMLAGEVSAARSRRAARVAEIDRATAARAEAIGRAERAEREYTSREQGVAGLDAGEGDLDGEYESAGQAAVRSRDRVVQLTEQARAVDAERAALTARRDALQLALGARDAAAELLAAGSATGTVAESVLVEAGWEAAVAAALGQWADAVVVQGPAAAVAALTALGEQDWGRAGMLVAGSATAPAKSTVGKAPVSPVGRPITDLVRARPGSPDLGGALRVLLTGVLAVADLAEAAAVVEAASAAGVTVTAVTRSGDLLSTATAAGGRSGRSSVELATAVADAEQALERAAHDAHRLRFDLAAATEAERAAADLAEAALERLHESDARLAAVAEELGHVGQVARAARAEVQRLHAALDAAQRSLVTDTADVGSCEQRLAAARAAAFALPGTLFDDAAAAVDDQPAAEPDGPEDLAAAAAALEVARGLEVDARLAQRGAEERLAAVAGRAAVLLRRAGDREAALDQARRAAGRARASAARAAAIAAGATWLADLVGAQVEVAGRVAAAAQAAAASAAGDVRAVRARLAVVEVELAAATDAVHATDLRVAGHRGELELIATQAGEQLSVTSEQLVAEFGPDAPLPEDLELPTGRVELESRRRRVERALAELGRVNPLALEEFDALGERLAFLTEQLRDLEASRTDLLGVIAEVDDRVRDAFSAAFADTATEFEAVFARLFPGGQGRIFLTDPDDPLTSGIEVEARPAGKKVARLSLLSGGERSLVAVALLVAIFRARPSPFYVLDEVEAALDDTNLSRLLSIYEELRETSQLLIVTHQKRTMEIADALYGVSMRGDGVTTVISQRVREREPVPA